MNIKKNATHLLNFSNHYKHIFLYVFWESFLSHFDIVETSVSNLIILKNIYAPFVRMINTIHFLKAHVVIFMLLYFAIPLPTKVKAELLNLVFVLKTVYFHIHKIFKFTQMKNHNIFSICQRLICVCLLHFWSTLLFWFQMERRQPRKVFATNPAV